ncbi:MAG TPA: uracil-DNA glycosylase [Stellaceae bacterium]
MNGGGRAAAERQRKAAATASGDPPPDCRRCPRLAAWREEQAAAFPDWHNAPVASFGPLDAALLVVGLAPGRRGANRTGRVFTGDGAGKILFDTLGRFGFMAGRYDGRADDGLRPVDCRITNAVRCLPPENRPTVAEIASCGPFLAAEVAAMPRLRAVLALGAVAHAATLAALTLRPAGYRFAHGAAHDLPNGLVLIDSYHCSRQNTNTGRLTPEMFADVFAAARRIVEAATAASDAAAPLSENSRARSLSGRS